MLADIRYVSVKDCVSEKVKITDNLEQGKQSFYPAIYCEWQIKITIYISWMTTQNHQQHIQHVSQHMELSVSTHPSACVKFRCSRTLSSTLYHSLSHTHIVGLGFNISTYLSRLSCATIQIQETETSYSHDRGGGREQGDRQPMRTLRCQLSGLKSRGSQPIPIFGFDLHFD